MIFETFVKSIREVEDVINELDTTYKGFDLKTILPISSGYLIFYKVGEKFTPKSEGEK